MAQAKTIVGHILQSAYNTIHQRAADRDVRQERSMKATVEAFNAIHGTKLTEAQGWSFMTLLKMKRSFTGDVFRDDDFVDEAAYTALRAEARHAECSAIQQDRQMQADMAKAVEENTSGFQS